MCGGTKRKKKHEGNRSSLTKGRRKTLSQTHRTRDIPSFRLVDTGEVGSYLCWVRGYGGGRYTIKVSINPKERKESKKI